MHRKGNQMEFFRSLRLVLHQPEWCSVDISCGQIFRKGSFLTKPAKDCFRHLSEKIKAPNNVGAFIFFFCTKFIW